MADLFSLATRRNRTVLTVAALALGTMVSATQAATVTMLQSKSGGRGKSVDTTTDLDASGLQRNLSGSSEGISEDTGAAKMRFDYFDASLGTLTGVNLTYTLTGTGNNLITRFSKNCSIFGVGSCSSNVSSNASVSYGILVEPYHTTLPGRPGYNNPTELGVGSSGIMSTGATTANLGFGPRTATVDVSSQLLNFIGDGQFDIQPIFVVRNTTSVSCNSSFGTNITECKGRTRVTYNANYRVDVSYTYDEVVEPPAVPLPAGLPLMLAGLGAFGLLRRKSA